MKRILPVILLASLSASSLFAQQVAIDSSDLEELRRTAGRVDQLEEAYSAAQKRLFNLTSELESLRDSLNEAQNAQSRKMVDLVTREDLKQVVESIKKVDADRANDKKVILEAIEKMGKELAKAPVVPPAGSDRSTRGSDNSQKPPEKKKEKEIATDKPVTNSRSELVYTYIVAPGDNLSKIIYAYNQEMKQLGKSPVTIESIRRANPKMNLNNIYVGQEIVIPVPPDKQKE